MCLQGADAVCLLCVSVCAIFCVCVCVCLRDFEALFSQSVDYGDGTDDNNDNLVVFI